MPNNFFTFLKAYTWALPPPPPPLSARHMCPSVCSLSIQLSTNPPSIYPSICPSVWPLSKGTLPLLPAEVVATSKHNEKAQDCEEDDGVSCHHEAAGTPLDL